MVLAWVGGWQVCEWHSWGKDSVWLIHSTVRDAGEGANKYPQIEQSKELCLLGGSDKSLQ
jgi:hypothetical protein